MRLACARIGAGQGELALVGGSFNADRPDVVLHYAMGGQLTQTPYLPVWQRQGGQPGMALGSVGCFLVIESRAHAAGRGAAPIARIAGVRTDRSRRGPGEAAANARAQIAALVPSLPAGRTAVVSAASGAPKATAEEAEFLAGLSLPVRGTASAIGHSLEPSFPAAIALAAMALEKGRLFAPLDPAERPMAERLDQVLVTSWGHWRGEATALLTAP